MSVILVDLTLDDDRLLDLGPDPRAAEAAASAALRLMVLALQTVLQRYLAFSAHNPLTVEIREQ